MSQYSGNQTNGGFTPRYAPTGETKDPINVVSTSMEIGGEMVEGYQSTYANGTSKWTPHVLTDTFLTDSHGTDNSTFTGTIQGDGTWKWEPTSDANVAKLAKNYRGPDKDKITEEQIENKFYDRKGNTLQQQLTTTQTKQLQAQYGEDLSTVKDGKFSNGPLSQQAENFSQTSESGAVETTDESMGFVSTML